MTCYRCNSPALEEDRFCGKCGTSLAQRDKATPQKVTMATLDSTFIKERLGIVYFKEERYMEALEMFESSLKMKPDNPVVREWIRKARTKLEETTPSASNS